MIPVFAGNIFVSVFIVAHMFSSNTAIYPCEEGNESECLLTFFDNIMDSPNNVNIDYTSLRIGRCGTCFLVMGAYILYVSLTILIPDKTREDRVPEAYDGNIWEYYTWKKSNMIFVSAFLLFFELGIIQFSFSPSYGDNVWLMLGVMTVVQILLEDVIERMVEEALLFSPLSVSIGVMQGLITFGANDFLDFLNGNFVGVGIQFFQRAYMDHIIDFIKGNIEEKLP